MTENLYIYIQSSLKKKKKTLVKALYSILVIQTQFTSGFTSLILIRLHWNKIMNKVSLTE